MRTGGQQEERSFVYLHSSNRAPDRAWPIAIQLPNARFAVMPGYDNSPAVPFDQDAWESQLLHACAPVGVIIAHSFGGPIAMRAAERRPDLVRALVLFEPAAYALARGTPAVEDHIARMQPVLERAQRLDAASFAVQFTIAMTGEVTHPPTTGEALIAAERQRMLPGPWSLDTPTQTRVPTLVITGGWSKEYEMIADRIEIADHVVLTGHGHRPQHHPAAADVICSFLEDTNQV